MDKDLLKEVIDTINQHGLMYQWHMRYMDAEERDMRPSECEQAAYDMVYDILYYDEFGDKFTDEIWEEIKMCMERCLECNDDFIIHPDIEPTELGFSVTKFGDGIRWG
jgi:hypothetical protein